VKKKKKKKKVIMIMHNMFKDGRKTIDGVLLYLC